MLVTALFLALVSCILAEPTTIYHDGVFSGLLYESTLSEKEGTVTLSYAYAVATCVSSLSVEATEKATVVLETITGHDNGVFIWGEDGRAEIVNGKGLISFAQPKCASRFRLTLSKGHFKDVSTDSEETDPTQKRIVTCVGVNTWPTDCGTAAEGQLCTSVSGQLICGCKIDADCYGNAVLPWCDTAQGICASCFKSPTASPNTRFSTHYFCRSRYPTFYITDPTRSRASPPTGPAITKLLSTVGERTPDIEFNKDIFAGFFKEVCATQSPDPSVKQNVGILGSCERCQQAAYLADIWFPRYTFTTPGIANPNEGPMATYFCRFIRGSATTLNSAVLPSQNPSPNRPICSTPDYFKAVGLDTLYLNENLFATEEVASLGEQNGGPAGVAATLNVIVNRSLYDWEGACVPCALYNNLTNTRIAYHGLCSYGLTLPISTPANTNIIVQSTPICNLATGNCDPCGSNADCGLGDQSQRPLATGGPNCMQDGRCIRCTQDSDCNGDLGNDPVCNTGTGICGPRILCNGNFGSGTSNACATAAAPNCYRDGICRDCRTATCANDGPSVGNTPDQAICGQSDGICRGCTTNDECSTAFPGTNNFNCYTDGGCRSCVTATCTNDGGQPGASPSGCTQVTSSTVQICRDKNAQTLCNPTTHRCEDPCVSNDFCETRTRALGVAGGGPNCQVSGFCINCGAVASPSTSCGVLDGPLTGIAGYNGITGETNCGPSGVCFNDVRCARNSDCTTGATTSNCQVTGGCVQCFVDYTSSSCSGADGGEVPNQPNCQQSTRQCVAPCNNEQQCVGTQGANCMRNGVCLNCRNNADCAATGNSWGGDRIGRTLCRNNLCEFACNANFGAAGTQPCGATAPNCQADGTCVRCTADTNCAGLDGPPGSGGNTICDTTTGICQNPWLCTNGGPGGTNADNVGCQARYSDAGRRNCNKDGSCTSCTSNAGCWANDGGLIPSQPRCGSDGVCTGCTSNADCPPEAANCMWDGSCQDCRRRVNTTGQCGGPNIDGPPGTPAPNPNCDVLTGICVDFCVRDSDCSNKDLCKPRCHLERGCCVECLSSNDCPVPQWRGTERASKTMCDTRNGYQCVFPVACSLDIDCPDATPACSYSENKCVQCKADAHCATRYPNTTVACDTGREVCVQCVSNFHCRYLGDAICDPRTNFCVMASAFTVSASLCLTLAMVVLAFIF